MKKKNYFLSAMAFVTATMLSLGFASCGGDDNGDSDTQPASTPSIKVNGTSSTDLTFTGSFDGKSGIDYKQSVAIVSTVQWTMSKDADWLSVSPSNGNGSLEMVIYPISENTSSTSRTATITLSGAGANATIKVTQGASSIKVNGTSSTDLTFTGSFDGKSGIDYKQSVTVVSTVQWTMSKDADWLSVSPSNGNGSLEMAIYPISENTSSTSRTATVTLSGAGVSATIKVTQGAGKPVCYVEPQNIVALYDRMAWEYSATGTVNKFQYIVLAEKDFNRMTEKEMITELSEQEEMKVADDYLSMIGSDSRGNRITQNSTYYVVTIAYNNEDKTGELKKVKVTTPAYLNADKDAWVSFENLSYYSNWGGFCFDTKKEGYCNTYHIVYGLYTERVNSVVHAFEINYYLKNKKKHWLADGWGWEITTDYPNNHTFTSVRDKKD